MLNIITVAFFGHRYIDNPTLVEERIELHIRRVLESNEYVDFIVGRSGDFDRCVSSAVCRVPCPQSCGRRKKLPCFNVAV